MYNVIGVKKGESESNIITKNLSGCDEGLAVWSFPGNGSSYHPSAPLRAQASVCQGRDQYLGIGRCWGASVSS